MRNTSRLPTTSVRCCLVHSFILSLCCVVSYSSPLVPDVSALFLCSSSLTLVVFTCPSLSFPPSGLSSVVPSLPASASLSNVPA